MSIDYEALKPFPSLLLLTFREHVRNQTIVSELLSTALHHLEQTAGPRVLAVGDVRSDDETTFGGVIFEAWVKPSWTIQPQPEDHIHDLLVIIQRKRLFAIYFSDRGWRDTLYKLARRHEEGAFKKVEPIDPGIMNAAFANGAARTLWLAGIHARSNIKSDSKVVAGADLINTLDALDDQSYHFTAARYRSDQLSFQTTIGFSPYESSFWVSQPMHWPAFLACADETLTHLETIQEPNYSPIAVLAAPLSRAETIAEAFDISLIAPELRSDPHQVRPDLRSNYELWAFNSDFVVTPRNGADARVEVRLAGENLGILDLTFDTSNPNDVACHAQIVRCDGNEVRLREARALFENRLWITVHYGSGHTLVGRTLISTRIREVALESGRLLWNSFDGVTLTQEKPRTWAELGHDRSLFSWLWNEWPCIGLQNAAGTRGWLACDDGANEVADFIHLDEDDPTITLVHVKGSGSADATRRISVGKFDVVVTQAVKNLRYLDQITLAQSVREGFNRQVGNLVIYNGQPATRADMVETLELFSSEAKRRVLVLQPHLLQSRWRDATADPESIDGRRMRMLNMVLVSADRSCRALNAHLHVLGQE